MGRKPWAIDCIGIVVVSLKAGGVFMQDRTDYGREPWNDGLEHDLHLHFGDPLPIDERQAGDIVLMKDEMQPAPVTLASSPRLIALFTATAKRVWLSTVLMMSGCVEWSACIVRSGVLNNVIIGDVVSRKLAIHKVTNIMGLGIPGLLHKAFMPGDPKNGPADTGRAIKPNSKEGDPGPIRTASAGQ